MVTDILKMLMVAYDVEALIPDNIVNSLGIFTLRRGHACFLYAYCHFTSEDGVSKL